MLSKLDGKDRDMLELSHKFIDQLIVRFKGGTLERHVEEIKDHPFIKYMIITELVIPLGRLHTFTTVAEYKNQVYLATALVPHEEVHNYEHEIMETIHSLAVLEEESEKIYHPPNQGFMIDFPQTPFFMHLLTKKQGILRHYKMFVDTHSPYTTRFQLEDIEFKHSRIQTKEDKIKFFKKILTQYEINELMNEKIIELENEQLYFAQFLTDANKVEIHSYWRGNHQYILTVRQDKKDTDESQAVSFFESFEIHH